MNIYFLIKTIHIISSTVLFGTGIGIAFFMYRSKFSNDIKEKLYAISGTVLADYIFTFPTVLIQLVTGAWLVWKAGYDWTDLWIVVTLLIYFIAGCCWIPVVLIQIKLKNILVTCIKENTALPEQYHKLFRVWFILGWPAFFGLIVVFFMMVNKPV